MIQMDKNKVYDNSKLHDGVRVAIIQEDDLDCFPLITELPIDIIIIPKDLVEKFKDSVFGANITAAVRRGMIVYADDIEYKGGIEEDL